ncbi:hypothetical protein ASPCADRAFT_404946 [Aspergillus carbonarius ITEM 5010]|uniref:Uncharacterized protein n=1 Tax=Aspergillus carbonarius (strain ITEM 5010) TaxID=602072 RepID=A0A1R3RPK6_ASPC5|nr:hypothetical protein ASPCADRAFT_404946 [Aspergillus carbonarius ITEM 5010]
MYHSHFATVPHDKVYALLGLCADDPNTPCLRPNYNLPWNVVVEQVVAYIFGGQCTVTALSDTQTAVIKGKGWVLGQINSVKWRNLGYYQQHIGIAFRNTPLAQRYRKKWGAEWVLQRSAASIQQGDIVGLLQGASRPSIIRLSKSRISVIISTGKPESVRREEEEEEDDDIFPSKSSEQTPSDIRSQKDNFTGEYSIDIILTWSMFMDSSEEIDESNNPTQLAPKSLVTLEGEEALNSRKLVMEDIFISLLEQGFRRGQIQLIRILLQQSPMKIPLSERVLRAAVEQPSLLEFFLHGQWENLPITEASIKEAEDDVYDLMQLLFYRKDVMMISEDLLKAVTTRGGYDIWRVLKAFYQHQECLPISDDVLRAAKHQYIRTPLEVLRCLCHRQPVTEEVVRAAAGEDLHGLEMIELLYQHQKSLPITGNVVRAAAENHYGFAIIVLLYEHQESLPVTEEVVWTAARNVNGFNIMELLYKHQGSLPLTEDVVQAAAGNLVKGSEIVKMLYQHQENLPITENVVRAAAGNLNEGSEVIRILLQHQENLPITENVVRAAAGNLYEGSEIINILFQYHETLPITEHVVRAAARNHKSGSEIIKIFHQHNEGMVEAAAKDPEYGEDVRDVIWELNSITVAKVQLRGEAHRIVAI